MIIGKLTAILAVIFLVTISKADAKRYGEFFEARDFYAFHSYEPKRIHRTVWHTRQKHIRIKAHKEKRFLSPLLPASQKEPISDLIKTARQYLGTNPTGWHSLWCGKFMSMIAPQAAKRIPNPNIARNWAKLPHTTARIGAILITSRYGGGHVGVVIGFDKYGNPITISGNHGHKVGIGKYAKNRILAYVKV